MKDFQKGDKVVICIDGSPFWKGTECMIIRTDPEATEFNYLLEHDGRRLWYSTNEIELAKEFMNEE